MNSRDIRDVNTKYDNRTEYPESNFLFDVLEHFFPFIASGELYANNCRVLAQDRFIVARLPREGTYDAIANLLAEIVHPSSRESFFSMYERDRLLISCSRGERFIESRFRILGDDNVYHWIRCELALHANPSGEGVAFLMLAKTDDGQKAAELEKESYARILDAVGDGACECAVLIDVATGIFEVFHASAGFRWLAGLPKMGDYSQLAGMVIEAAGASLLEAPGTQGPAGEGQAGLASVADLAAGLPLAAVTRQLAEGGSLAFQIASQGARRNLRFSQFDKDDKRLLLTIIRI
jgi:hypothetical protein